MYCRQHCTENYKKMYEIWRQRNPESRMYMDGKKLLNQKNYIMKHSKTTEMGIGEIKKELQANQRCELEEREEERLEHLGTIRIENRSRTQHLQQKKKRRFIIKGIRLTN